jgi:hypothetical protein
MTNKEIAQRVTNIVFTQKDGTPDCDAFALQLLIEALNTPSKYNKEGVGYHRNHMEEAISDILKDKRLNGVHFMDLSEPMHKEE